MTGSLGEFVHTQPGAIVKLPLRLSWGQAMLQLLLLPLAAVAAAAALRAPHILLVLADDYGYNDVGYHESKPSSANPAGNPTSNPLAGQPKTPFLDSLASESMRLEMYYVQPLCSPTRSTIMTGRFTSHTGVGPNVIKPSAPYAVPKNETFLPELLVEAGYATHAVGKWHMGYCDVRYSPTYRGFSSFTGYLNGAEDYWDHTRADGSFYGLDFRAGGATNSLPPATNASFDVYSAFVFANAVAKIVTSHGATSPQTPLFVYLPFQSVHNPLQAPVEYENMYLEVNNTDRKTTCAMITAMDNATKEVVAAYKQAGLWDDTVLVFSTDNGGPLPSHTNYPLRSGKAHNWEGGVRGIGFVRGTNSALAKVPAGETQELMHTTDWLPTLVKLGGGSVEGKTRPLDGFDIWPVITGHAKATRSIIAHNVPTTGYAGAFRMNRLKLLLLGNSSSSIFGMQTTKGATQLPPPGFPANPHDVVPEPFEWTPPGADPEAAAVQLWLHDVVSDPTESINLAAHKPQLLQQMLAAFEEYQKGAVPDLADVRGCGAGGAVGCDPAADPALRADKAWGPFTDSKRCEWL